MDNLTEVTTDVKWIKASLTNIAETNCKDHAEIISRINYINGNVRSNCAWIGAFKWVIGALGAAVLSMGIYLLSL